MAQTTTPQKSASRKPKAQRPPNAMANALSASMSAETDSFKARLEKAEMALETSASQTVPQSQTQTAHGQRSSVTDTNTSTRPEIARVIRDAFTMPEDDYILIEQTRQRCLKKAVRITKAEALRAGLQSLSRMSDAELITTINQLEKVRTGRPKSSTRD